MRKALVGLGLLMAAVSAAPANAENMVVQADVAVRVLGYNIVYTDPPVAIIVIGCSERPSREPLCALIEQNNPDPIEVGDEETGVTVSAGGERIPQP